MIWLGVIEKNLQTSGFWRENYPRGTSCNIHDRKNFEQWQWPKTGLHKSHPNLWPRLTNIPYFSSLYLSFANVVINSDLHTMFAATLFTMGTGKFQAASYLIAMVKRCPLVKSNLQIINFCTWHRQKESWLTSTQMTVRGLGYSIGLSKIV